jgi:DnaK suppressor protein
MKHLSDPQISALAEELETQLRKLEKSMSVTDEALKTVELDQTAVGRLSRMDSMLSQGMAQGLRERETVKLSLLRAALERFQAGTYGICTACGETVPFERLIVFPESPVCAGCGL